MLRNPRDKKLVEPNEVSLDHEVNTKELLIKDIKNISKLEILEVNIQKEVKITKGDFFKKEQNIIFEANGKYILDLSLLEDKNIVIDENNKNITIFSGFPKIEVNFNESKTQIYETEKSWFTIGDLKLSTQEFETIKAKTKEEILNELEDNDSYNTAISGSSKTLEEILNKISKENYSIKIYYIR